MYVFAAGLHHDGTLHISVFWHIVTLGSLEIRKDRFREKSLFGKETMMKYQMKIGTFFILCVLLLNLAGCAVASTFEGNSVKNADSYALDIKAMNGTDTHTLKLKAGDTLKIQFAVEKGSLDMKITVPDGTALYQGDGTVKEFTVEAPMDGIYPIVVVGQKATGSIHIDVERVPEAVEPVGTQEPESEIFFGRIDGI